MDKEESFRNSTCEDQINMAERELSAFIRAVTELFGPEQARLSIEDWLNQSELMDSPHRATRKEWRAAAMAASARLANRETLALDHRAIAKSTDTKVSPILWSNCFASALNSLQFTGDDFFAGKDSCSIMLEVSNSALGSGRGRALTDDVVDFFLPFLTNGKVTRDNVGPHTDLLTSFPYVGSPHKIRSAERAAA
jgi:hypothetical protein